MNEERKRNGGGRDLEKFLEGEGRRKSHQTFSSFILFRKWLGYLRPADFAADNILHDHCCEVISKYVLEWRGSTGKERCGKEPVEGKRKGKAEVKRRMVVN
jgi:hypothetical protein